MRFVRFAGEKTIADLVHAHYGAALSAAEVKKAEKLVVEANPQLKAIRDVPPGAVLRLPPIATKKAPAAAQDSEDVALRIQAFDQQFGQLTADLRTAVADEGEALKQDRNFSDGLKRLIEEVKDARPMFEEVRRGLKTREERLSGAQDLLKQLPGIQEEVEKLLRD